MTRVICGDQWISYCENDDGDGFVQMEDAVLVVPVDADGNVLAITEWSAAYRERVLVLPGGIVDDGESSEEAANRELQEEIGLRAASIEPLARLYPLHKYVNAATEVFLAQEFTESRLEGDEGWEIEIERIPLREAAAAAAAGRPADSTVVAALLLAARHLRVDG